EFATDFRALLYQLTELVGETESDAKLRPVAEGLDRCRTKLDDAVTSAWSLRLVPGQAAPEEAGPDAHARGQGPGTRRQGGGAGGGVVGALKEPLLHLVRNAVDHGIELPAARGEKNPEGALKVQATTVGAHLVVEVADDGRGVDFETVRAGAVARGWYDPAA